MKCTRCWFNKEIKIDWNLYIQEHSGLVAPPEQFNIRLCADCVFDLFKSIWNLMDESSEIKLIKRYGERVATQINGEPIMPKEYELMKKAMKKQYGKKKGEKVAAKTWNKRMKGTGKTVGRGRE